MKSSVAPNLCAEGSLAGQSNAGRLSLKRNFSWTLIGNIIYAACQWGILAAIAKLGNPEMVGQFALATAITAPIMLFSNLKLRSIQASDALEEYAFIDYLSLRLVTTPLAFAIIIVLAAYTYRETEITFFAIIILGAAKALESISDIIYGLLQQHERMDRIAASQIIKGFVSLIAFSIALYSTGSLVWSLLAIFLSWLVVLFLYDIPIAIALLGSLSKSTFNRMPSISSVRSLVSRQSKLVTLALLAFPLGLTVMLSTLNVNLPRYFIEHFRGTHDLGIYAAISYVLVASGILINALGQSATPRLAKYHSEGNNREFKTLLYRLLGCGGVLGAAGISTVLMFGHQILFILYGKEYASQAEVFFWIMLDAAIGYTYVFLGTAASAMRKFSVQLPIHVASIIMLAILCWLLVPSYGSRGAAWALSISGLFEAILYAAIIGAALYRDSASPSLSKS